MENQVAKKQVIIWADDDPDDLLIARETMQMIGSNYQLVDVSNGKEVIEYLFSVKESVDYPCLVILDNNMPILSGLAALNLIKKEQRFRHIPVIIVTTSFSEQDAVIFSRLGAATYAKPNSIEKYRDLFLELLKHCR